MLDLDLWVVGSGKVGLDGSTIPQPYDIANVQRTYVQLIAEATMLLDMAK